MWSHKLKLDNDIVKLKCFCRCLRRTDGGASSASAGQLAAPCRRPAGLIVPRSSYLGSHCETLFLVYASRKPAEWHWNDVSRWRSETDEFETECQWDPRKLLVSTGPLPLPSLHHALYQHISWFCAIRLTVCICGNFYKFLCCGEVSSSQLSRQCILGFSKLGSEEC